MKGFRIAILVAVCIVAGLIVLYAAGKVIACAGQPPIATGKLEMVTVWAKPVQRPGEMGSNSGETFSDGKVAIYDQFIIITMPDGRKVLSLHGWYTNLRFR